MSLENEGATAEVEQLDPIEQDQPISMDDTIRNTLRELNEKSSTDENTTPEAPEEAAQRIRDASGKYAAKPAEEVAPEPVAEAAPEVAAPNTWKKEAAQEWAKLPPVIRNEVARREADFHRGIEQYREKATFAQNIERTIAPYAQTLQSLNIAPEKAIGELMAADHKLRYGSPAEKHSYFAQLAQSYGIDLGQVQNAPPVDPNINYLQQQVQQLSGYIQTQQQEAQQQANQALNSEIEAFSADPKHSHFESVKGHMAALLQAGQAKDLADAYEQAIYANPVTRAAVLAEQQAAQRAAAAEKAQAAKKAASVNFKSRPSMPTTQPIGTMDDTIRDTLRRLQGA